MAGEAAAAPSVDFVGGAVGFRFRSSAARNHALVKATGILGLNAPHVVDATAGLGRDSFLLASLGAHVTMIERSPEIHRLLLEGMDTARMAGPALAEVIGRMTLINADARQALPRLHADVVMVDPMHPPRKKAALVKQDMRLLRQLVGADPDVLELMQAALACDCNRVVLKWPLRAEAMAGLRKPAYQIAGKTVRYDVFLPPLAPKDAAGVQSGAPVNP